MPMVLEEDKPYMHKVETNTNFQQINVEHQIVT